MERSEGKMKRQDLGRKKETRMEQRRNTKGKRQDSGRKKETRQSREGRQGRGKQRGRTAWRLGRRGRYR